MHGNNDKRVQSILKHLIRNEKLHNNIIFIFIYFIINYKRREEQNFNK